MKRTFSALAIATATLTAFATPSLAGFLSSTDRAEIARVTGHEAANLTLSQEAALHALMTTGEARYSPSASRNAMERILDW